MHWMISRFPELETLEPGERAEVLRRIPWWAYPLMGVRSVVPALIPGIFGVVAAGEWFGMGDMGCTITGVTTGVLLAIFLYQWQMRGLRTEMRRTISRGFAGRRLPFCFGCGYDLRGCPADRCPECGRSIIARENSVA